MCLLMVPIMLTCTSNVIFSVTEFSVLQNTRRHDDIPTHGRSPLYWECTERPGKPRVNLSLCPFTCRNPTVSFFIPLAKVQFPDWDGLVYTWVFKTLGSPQGQWEGCDPKWPPSYPPGEQEHRSDRGSDVTSLYKQNVWQMWLRLMDEQLNKCFFQLSLMLNWMYISTWSFTKCQNCFEKSIQMLIEIWL